MTEAAPDVPERGRETRTVIRWILWIQLGLAGVLVGSDLSRILPDLASPSRAPSLTEPLRPGDQTRRYAPGDIAPRQSPPGARPVPVSDDMPSRLLFEATTWEDRPTVTVTGTIETGDAERFEEFLRTQTIPPELVYLNSPGGSVRDAIAIGRTLRGLAVETRMTGADICLSACPYILAGGALRMVEDGAMVGVHQHYFGENVALPAFLAVEDIQRGQGEVMAYLDEMGIDPLLMQPAMMTPPSEIYLLTAEELERYALVTPPSGSDEGG